MFSLCHSFFLSFLLSSFCLSVFLSLFLSLFPSLFIPFFLHALLSFLLSVPFLSFSRSCFALSISLSIGSLSAAPSTKSAPQGARILRPQQLAHPLQSDLQTALLSFPKCCACHES